MRGAVVAVGSELLLGDVVNSNAATLGRELAACGVEVVTSVAVADDLERLVEVLRLCLADADVVVLCGGLGPTVDDLTRDAVARACEAPLVRDEGLVAHLAQVLAPYVETVPPDVMRQADVPEGAEVLPNTAGTAPGLWLDKGGKVVVALPGPPRELAAVAPPVWDRLAARTGRRFTTRQVLVSGLGESVVAARVEPGLRLPPGVALSYLAGGALVRVRFTGLDPAALDPLVAHVDEVLGDHVAGHDDDTLDAVVHRLLAERGQTLAVAESLTGGMLAAALTDRAGASETFRGGVVVYATDLKETLAGVPHALLDVAGPVSDATAAALAAGARDRLGADWGLGVTGVAGPSEQDGHPVGTVFVAVAGPEDGEVCRLQLPGGRAQVRARSVTSALDLLRRHLAGKSGPRA
ncbi:MAG TPA: CinA family nicotinamide mononucleotide deamidase-related protein [Mycobacteriales bacterium]|nr:CinA family nicotinamide mononucleotide deamidase-related protein [Mycobacteriales bacterium]